jgi:hypothetical protein
MCVCIYYSHTIQIHLMFFIQCSLMFPFDLLLRHDFLHAYMQQIVVILRLPEERGS